MEKKYEYRNNLWQVFVDFSKAYDIACIILYTSLVPEKANQAHQNVYVKHNLSSENTK